MKRNFRFSKSPFIGSLFNCEGKPTYSVRQACLPKRSQAGTKTEGTKKHDNKKELNRAYLGNRLKRQWSEVLAI